VTKKTPQPQFSFSVAHYGTYGAMHSLLVLQMSINDPITRFDRMYSYPPKGNLARFASCATALAMWSMSRFAAGDRDLAIITVANTPNTNARHTIVLMTRNETIIQFKVSLPRRSHRPRASSINE
jgi:hypothetical protein